MDIFFFTQIWRKIYFNQFVSEMLGFLQQGSTRWVPQPDLNDFVSMAIYWVTDLSILKGSFSNLWRSILIFTDDAWSEWSGNRICMSGRMAWFKFLSKKSLKYEITGKRLVAMETEIIITGCAARGTININVPSFNGRGRLEAPF